MLSSFSEPIPSPPSSPKGSDARNIAVSKNNKANRNAQQHACTKFPYSPHAPRSNNAIKQAELYKGQANGGCAGLKRSRGLFNEGKQTSRTHFFLLGHQHSFSMFLGPLPGNVVPRIDDASCVACIVHPWMATCSWKNRLDNELRTNSSIGFPMTLGSPRLWKKDQTKPRP